MSFATLRATLAADIANPTVYQVFAFPPATPIANSVSIVPDDPYVQITNNNTALSLTARFKLELCIPLLDNQGNLAGIETMILGLVPLIKNTDYNISSVSQPRSLALPSGDLLTCDVSVETLTSWS